MSRKKTLFRQHFPPDTCLRAGGAPEGQSTWGSHCGDAGELRARLIPRSQQAPRVWLCSTCALCSASQIAPVSLSSPQRRQRQTCLVKSCAPRLLWHHLGPEAAPAQPGEGLCCLGRRGTQVHQLCLTTTAPAGKAAPGFEPPSSQPHF